ncbi:transglycosylase domain-containing protein [Pseudarthrobacter sp. H2]|uniref:transglycosylase domain-containing protein n=1 Tax=Pseudarthrobacter sp. H2 TaxID=3418415 RepID=UPI003CEEA94B
MATVAVPATTTVTSSPRKRKKHRLLRFIGGCFKLLFVLVILSLVATVSFIWWTPPRTSYMLQGGEPVAYQFVSIDHISRFALAATIAHEDQQLGTRPGAFDMEDFQARAKANLEGKPDPSGSTIPQQLVKNIFLWPDQSALRKGLEAGLASEFSFILTDKRVLELYLNYAQFGPHVYGICAATWYYYNTPPSRMTEYQAAQLMGVLPLPNRVRRPAEGGISLDKRTDSLVWEYVNGAANVWVPRQIEGMGGWQQAVATVGIYDLASDHVTTAYKADGCSTMPQSVRDRLDSNVRK